MSVRTGRSVARRRVRRGARPGRRRSRIGDVHHAGAGDHARSGASQRSHGEGHRQSMVAGRVDRASGRRAVAFGAKPVGAFLDPHADGPQAGRERRDAVAFLVAQLGRARDLDGRAMRGEGAEDGQLVDQGRYFGGADRDVAEPARPDPDAAAGLAPGGVRDVHLDVGSGAPQDVEERGARRIQADRFEGDVGLGNRGRGDGPESGGRRIPGHRQRQRAERRAAGDADGAVGAGHRRAERLERPLGVVPRRRPLANPRDAPGVQAGQQHRALHLCAGDRRGIGDALQGAAPDTQRRAPVSGVDVPAHPLQRVDDAPHRTALQRRVAGQNGVERVAGEDAGEQAHGRARVAGVEHLRWTHQRPDSAARDGHRGRLTGLRGLLDLDPEGAQTPQRRAAVGAGRVAADRRGAPGQRRQQRVTVRDGLVARDPQPPAQAPRRFHGDGGRRRGAHARPL